METQLKNSEGDRESMHEKMMTIRKEKNSALKKILPEDQY